MRTYLLVLLCCLTGFSAFAQKDQKSLERALFALPDVAFTLMSPAGQTPLVYELRIKQPLDHQHPEKGSFFQYAVLTHRGFDRATVMNTQGYNFNKGKSEIELMFDANSINIEHRFFGESVPDPLKYEYLNLEQVTADLHHINELFRQVYNGKWISTGISKGGQTTIFYRYFYPNDVDVSVPYVAPFNGSLEDKRIYTFLDTVGSPECRQKIYQFQKYLLEHETEALEKLKWYSKGAELTYDYLGSIDKAYEYAVLEFSFSFWQWGSNCNDIPTNGKLDEYLDYLLKVSNLDFFADKGMTNYASHYYQAATQMGYYGYNIEPFKKYLKQFKTNPLASFAPKNSNPPPYDNSLNEKVDKWLKADGNNILYIYGGSDTWSADRITPSTNVNSKSFILPGKDHGHARVRYMAPAMQQDFVSTLEQWLGLKADMGKLK